MANLDEIISANANEFENAETIKESFTAISSKLAKLGYDTILNHKEKAEFVPSSRLSDVVAQRDSFKSQVEELNSKLNSMKEGADGNVKLQNEIQKLMDKNDLLLKDLENAKIVSEVVSSAKDARNPKDLLAFINMGNIKVNAKGEILGVDSEIQRLRTEKPYMFETAGGSNSNRGGSDSSGGQSNTAVGMNALIRRAAGSSI